MNPINSYLTFVNKLKEEEVKLIAKLYAETEKQILTSINSGLLNAKDLVFFKGKLTEAQKILSYLDSGASQWAQAMVKDMYGAGVKFAGLTANISVSAADLQNKFNLQAMKVISDNIYNRFQDISALVGRRIDGIYRTTALEAIKSNISGFDSLSKVAGNLRKGLADQGITGFTDKAGKAWNMQTYSEMVARTTTMETFRQGTGNEYLQNNIDLVQITGGSANSCDVCSKWEDQIVSLSGTDENYPSLDSAIAEGLFHPNCVHSYHVVIPDLTTLTKENDRLQKIYENS